MRCSDSVAKLAAALVAANAEVENALKNQNNPAFRSKYADLGEILRVVKPVYAAHGLTVVQMPGYDNGDVAQLESLILHESGEWISSVAGAPMPMRFTKKGEELPPDAQAMGSCITYLRRYSLAAIAQITQEDDDGNAATRRDEQAQQAVLPASQELVEEVQVAVLQAARVGLDSAKPEGVLACEQAIKERDAVKLRKCLLWLKHHIAEAEQVEDDTDAGEPPAGGYES